MFCSGVVNLGAYFADTYWALCVYVILYGFLDGSFTSLVSLVTLEITGFDQFAHGHGIMLTMIGIPSAIGPAVIG